jgi:hypothetical protein
MTEETMTPAPTTTLEEPTRVDTVEPEPLDPYAPEGGWQPADFPQLSVVLIPYTANSGVRADPSITIIPDGWMFIETGNVRLAVPDRIEWAKFVNMGERMWNTHERDLAEAKAAEQDVESWNTPNHSASTESSALSAPEASM